MKPAAQHPSPPGMKVAFATSERLSKRAVRSARSETHSKDNWFLLSPGSADLIPMPTTKAPRPTPFRSTDAAMVTTADGEIDVVHYVAAVTARMEAQIDASHMLAFLPGERAATPVADDATEIGQLAAMVASRMKQEAPIELLRKVDAVIVCTTGIDSQFGVSLAGKVQHILGASHAFPVLVAQQDGCSAYEAMRIARAFLHGPERARVVAVVATECWLYPYFRSFGTYAQYGDGAAAVLLTAQEAPDAGTQGSQVVNDARDDFEIVDIAHHRYASAAGPFDSSTDPWFRTPGWPQAVGEFLAGFLKRHAMTAGSLVAVRAPDLDDAFVEAVARASGIPMQANDDGFLSAVDPLLAFQAPSDGDVGPGGFALSWSVGLNGEMGACLYRKPGDMRDNRQDAMR